MFDKQKTYYKNNIRLELSNSKKIVSYQLYKQFINKRILRNRCVWKSLYEDGESQMLAMGVEHWYKSIVKNILPCNLVVSACDPVKSIKKPTKRAYCNIAIVVYVTHLQHRIIQLSNKVWITA